MNVRDSGMLAAVPGPNHWHFASLAGREANVQGLGTIRLQTSDTLETGEILKLANGATIIPTCMKVVQYHMGRAGVTPGVGPLTNRSIAGIWEGSLGTATFPIRVP